MKVEFRPTEPGDRLEAAYPGRPVARSQAKGAAGMRRRGADLAVLLPNLDIGGGELSMLRIAHGLAEEGMAVDLLTPRARGGLLDALSPLPLVVLRGGSTGLAAPHLAAYVAWTRPRVLISGQPHLNVAAVAACAATGHRTRVVIVEHTPPLSRQLVAGGGWRDRAVARLLPAAYRRSAAIVAVSRGVRDELRRVVPGIEPEIIHNPVLPDDLERLQAAPGGHPWLKDGGPPVVVSAGRLAAEKDFPALVRALAVVTRHRPVRLLVLGEGPDRARIVATAESERVADRVALPGAVTNVFAPLSRASAFALASRFEGFGNVLVEALACRLPVVSTDCPVGPREVLAGGRFGRLVPPGDTEALAAGILATLDAAAAPPGLEDHLRPFTVRASVAAYRRLVARIWPSSLAERHLL